MNGSWLIAIGKWKPSKMNEELRIAREHQSLISAGNKLAWGWGNGAEALDRILWPLALSAVELLISGELTIPMAYVEAVRI